MIQNENILRILFFTIFTLCLNQLNISAKEIDSLKVKSFFRQATTYYQEEDYEKAREYAVKVLEINPNFGEAYILIGSAYASSADKCSDSHFSKGMVYCLAVDMFEMAKRVDSSQIDRSSQLIKAYSNYFPSREQCIFISPPREGDKYKIDCWINEETTVRFSED